MDEIYKEENDLTQIHETLSKIKKDIKTINKNSKKSIMSIESLKEELQHNNEQTFKLKKSLEEKIHNEVKIYRKILIILDEIDSLYEMADRLKNKELLSSLEVMKKIISKEMSEIDLFEIKSLGEIFNPEIHKCIGVENDIYKESKEIITVAKKGYILNGKVLRPASVIICK